MALKVYVSTDKASYFKTNVMKCGENPPTEGYYNVGDIVISSVQEGDVFGWVCTKSGKPGKWKNICNAYEVKQNIHTHETEIVRINSMLEIVEQLIDGMFLDIDQLDKNLKNFEINATNTHVVLQSGIEKNVESINNLNERLQDIEGDVVDIIKNNIGDAVGDLEGVFGESVKQLQTDINGLRNEVVNNDKDIANLRKDINTNISNINNLNDQLDDVVVDINNIKNNIGDVVGGLEGNFSESVKQIQTQVLKNTEDIAKINVKLNNFENVHTQLENRINTNTTALGNINTIIGTMDDSIERVESNIEQLQQLVIGLQNTVASNNEKLAQIDKNATSINSIKQGLINALVNKGVEAGDGTSWEDLFNKLLNNGGGSNEPETPPEDDNTVYCTGLSFSQTDVALKVGDVYNLRSILRVEPENCTEEIVWVRGTGNENFVTFDYTKAVLTALGVGSIVMQAKCGTQIATVRFNITATVEEDVTIEPIYLLQNGKFNNNTAFGNARPTDYLLNSSTIYPDCLFNTMITTLSGFSYITMCFDGSIDINSYEKIEIVCATGYTYETTIAVGVLDNIVEYGGSDSTSFNSLPLKTQLTHVSFKSYTFNINDLNRNGNGYLTLGIHVHNTSGHIQIKDIIVHPKQRTDGIVLFENGASNGTNEFGSISVGTSVNGVSGFTSDKQGNAVIGYKFENGRTIGYFSFNNFVNFNNYDTIEVTAYTENNDQEAVLQVARGSVQGSCGYISNYYTHIPNSYQALSANITGKKQPTVYSISMQDLAKSSGINDGNSGYLCIGLLRNATGDPTQGDGFVYISKIVVYPEA